LGGWKWESAIYLMSKPVRLGRGVKPQNAKVEAKE